MTTVPSKRLHQAVKFNPRNLPTEKIGTCKDDDHEGKRRNLHVNLTMRFYELDDEMKATDEQMYESGTEAYVCDECAEALI